jgi:hypothetical protein
LKTNFTKEIEALRRNWATQFFLPVQDLNVHAMKKRYQLSFCRLLSMAAKGFIAQAGAEGYNANTAVMDLLAIHGNDINTHDFLVLFKEAAGLTIIPFPTVLHNLTDVINKVNGDAQAGALGNNNKNLARATAAMTTTMMGMTTTTMTTTTSAAEATTMTMAAMMATTATMAMTEAMARTLTMTAAMAALAAANTLAKLIMVATAAVTRATSQKDLAHAIAEQARSIADKSLKCCTNARTALEEACRTQASMIDPIKIAKANKMIKVAEVTVSKLERAATAKENIAYGANAFAESVQQTPRRCKRSQKTPRSSSRRCFREYGEQQQLSVLSEDYDDTPVNINHLLNPNKDDHCDHHPRYNHLRKPVCSSILSPPSRDCCCSQGDQHSPRT